MADYPDGARSVPFDPGLRRLMADRGISYRRLAGATGLSAGYVNHLAHGNRPAPADDVIERIAAVLAVPPDRFLEYRVRRIGEALMRDATRADRVYRDVCG